MPKEIKDGDMKTFLLYLRGDGKIKKKGGEKQTKAINRLRREMLAAAKKQEYEKAAYLRDLIIELEGDLKGEE